MYKNIAKQVWEDLVNCAKLCTSFAGVVSAGIAVINFFGAGLSKLDFSTIDVEKPLQPSTQVKIN